MDTLKQRVFAATFGAFDWGESIRRYQEMFETPEEPDLEAEDYEPQTEQDIKEMLNAARRAGAIR